MCYRYYIGTNFYIEKRFSTVPFGLGLQPNLSASPSQFLPIIRESAEGRKISLAKWGLIPSWAKNDDFASKLANARLESIETKPSFARPFKFKRCIVPVSGFYEWEHREGEKIKYSIEPEDGNGFGLAGLWDEWMPPNGDPIISYTILTTNPTPKIKKIHQRMPVILENDEESIWLAEDSKTDSLKQLFDPYPYRKLKVFQTETH
ncbi:SOS response-associated peptidase [Candidatus Dojkabacteria bacterium]|nr:SOS response-associated peptidase [Candidatus Dojkabacteria bacterium]